MNNIIEEMTRPIIRRIEMLHKILLIILILSAVTGCGNKYPEDTYTDDYGVIEGRDTEEDNNVSLDKLPVTRAMAAKMLALAFSDPNEIETMDREILFSDTSPDIWYDKYINLCFIQGLMSGGEDGVFEPEKYLTLEQAQLLLDRIDRNNKIKIKLTKETKDKPISYALWTQLYLKALKNLGGDDIKKAYSISEDSVVIMTNAESNGKLRRWMAITDKGPLSYEGLYINRYNDRRIKILEKDGEAVAILGEEDREPTIRNAYIVKTAPDSITIFTGGVSKTYSYANDLKNVSGGIADVKISGGNALEVNLHDEKASGTVKMIDENKIEMLSDGETKSIPLDNTKIYSIIGDALKWRGLSDVIAGADIYEIILKDDAVSAILINGVVSPETIRVCISTTGFSSLVHEAVSLTSESDYTVTIGGEVKNYKAGEVLNISKQENPDLFGEERIYIKSLDADGKIALTSVNRALTKSESPGYRGTIEIGKKDGGYTVVNEVMLEQYLYGVVPSEMPESYGLESLKVQALAARSYAYNQYFMNRYHEYGAVVDDSVSCQVYNNIDENEAATTAVNETKGQCIAYNGNVITANYFSTCAGVTSNSGEVWANAVTKQFPSETKEYLVSKEQYIGADYGDLSVEENMQKFIKSTNIQSYDSHAAWFRWNVIMTAEELTASINHNLKSRYEAAPKHLKTKVAEHIYRSRPATTIGYIKDLEVTKRGAGGIVMEMRITGDKAEVLVSAENNIRMLIRPMQYTNDEEPVVVNLMDGTGKENLPSMPSGFFVTEKAFDDKGNLQSVQFFGGGYGHGVGMSQNGVLGMVKSGHSYEDIIKHYYNGTEIKAVY